MGIRFIGEFLMSEGLITAGNDTLQPTEFGQRTSQLYIDPASAVILRDALRRAATAARSCASRAGPSRRWR